MRKLKPLEIVALSALMSVGSYAESQDAEELPITSLSTVTVTASYFPSGSAIIFPNYGPPASIYPGAASAPLVNQAMKTKAENCAKQYGSYQKPANFTLAYDNKYAWKSTYSNTVAFSNYNTQPAFGPWTHVAGITHVRTNPPVREITIYVEGYASFQELLVTLVHEFAHANGVSQQDDAIAESAGQNAYYNYLADSGAKCGGL
jgi:hypothetical protein